MKKTITQIHQILVVDFQKKKLISTISHEVEVKIKKTKKYNFKNFNPVPEGTNFSSFSDKERMEYSNHILAHIHEASFSDLVHWANMGMIDMEKVNDLLKLDITNPKRQKKVT